MISEGFILTIAGMSSVFLFLLFLVGSMYLIALIFQYLEVADIEKTDQEDEGLIAAIVAVKLKKN